MTDPFAPLDALARPVMGREPTPGERAEIRAAIAAQPLGIVASAVPAFLPIPDADPKAWYRSSTIWSGIGQIVLGLAVIVLAALDLLPDAIATGLGIQAGGAAAFGAGQIGLGVLTLRGRSRAAQPIAPLFGTRQ